MPASVTVLTTDNVRIVVPGGKAVTLPAGQLLGVWEVLKRCHLYGHRLVIEPAGEEGWRAALDDGEQGAFEGATPLQALAELAGAGEEG